MKRDITDDTFRAVIDSYRQYTDKQRLILIAAAELFSHKGYANTSTLEIAAMAGVSEGSIFRRFHNKENLLMAVIDPVLNQILSQSLHEFSDKAQTASPSLIELITSIVHDRIENGRTWFPLLKTFLNELLYTPELRSRLLQAVPADVIHALDKQLLDMKKKHLLIDWDNQEIIRFLMAAIWGYLIQHYVIWPEHPWSSQTEEQHLIDGLVQALSPR